MIPLTDLHEERPVLLYDQLDSGNSDHPNDPSNWTVERFVDEIPAIRHAFELPLEAKLPQRLLRKRYRTDYWYLGRTAP